MPQTPGVTPMAARSSGTRIGGPSGPACSTYRSCRTATIFRQTLPSCNLSPRQRNGTSCGASRAAKFLYWISRGNLGSYLDAISFGEAIGETPSTATVRTQRTKDGVGLNFAQQIAPDLGIFARAGLSQGTVEEIDFTDINRSISGGLLLTGSRWGRPDDTFGLAGAINRTRIRASFISLPAGLAASSATVSYPTPVRSRSSKLFIVSVSSTGRISAWTISSSRTRPITAT